MKKQTPLYTTFEECNLKMYTSDVLYDILQTWRKLLIGYCMTIDRLYKDNLASEDNLSELTRR